MQWPSLLYSWVRDVHVKCFIMASSSILSILSLNTIPIPIPFTIILHPTPSDYQPYQPKQRSWWWVLCFGWKGLIDSISISISIPLPKPYLNESTLFDSFSLHPFNHSLLMNVTKVDKRDWTRMIVNDWSSSHWSECICISYHIISNPKP